MWETIRGYLTFTRKERYGVLFLLTVIGILFVLPYFFRPRPGDPDPSSYKKMKEAIRKFETEHPDSIDDAEVSDRYTHAKRPGKETGIQVQPFNGKMQDFDPNTQTKEDWLRLGLSEQVCLTITRYVEKGGRFHRPEDLKKIYGLDLSDYDRLLPFVRIAERTDHFQSRSIHYGKHTYDFSPIKKTDLNFSKRPVSLMTGAESFHSGKKLEITDINLSDSADWSRLPGIGSRLASRIVHFREKLGGFYQVDQVGETFGLPDSIFQRLKPVLRLNPASVVQLDVNNSSKELLQAHPYIGWQIAKSIVAYRSQHGKFRTVDELLQLALMDTVRFGKLKPYLILSP